MTAPGHRDLTTQIFVAGSEYIESDTVFAVKKSLVADFDEVTDKVLAEKWGVKVLFRHADFDIIMQPYGWSPGEELLPIARDALAAEVEELPGPEGRTTRSRWTPSTRWPGA